MKGERYRGTIRFGLSKDEYYNLSVDGFISNLAGCSNVDKEGLERVHLKIREYFLDGDLNAHFTQEELAGKMIAYTVFERIVMGLGVSENRTSAFVSKIIWEMAKEKIGNLEELNDAHDEERKMVDVFSGMLYKEIKHVS